MLPIEAPGGVVRVAFSKREVLEIGDTIAVYLDIGSRRCHLSPASLDVIGVAAIVSWMHIFVIGLICLRDYVSSVLGFV